MPRDAIKVRVEKGWVTLTGEVAWHFQKDAAECMIRSLHGVVAVSNQTTIKPRVNTTNIGQAKLKAFLRRAAARTVDDLSRAIGSAIDTFTPAECANYFAAAGYDAY